MIKDNDNPFDILEDRVFYLKEETSTKITELTIQINNLEQRISELESVINILVKKINKMEGNK